MLVQEFTLPWGMVQDRGRCPFLLLLAQPVQLPVAVRWSVYDVVRRACHGTRMCLLRLRGYLTSACRATAVPVWPLDVHMLGTRLALACRICGAT